MGIGKRIAALCRAVFGGKPKSQDDEEALGLKRDLAASRLDLQEARNALEKERARLQTLESGQSANVSQSTEARLMAVFTTPAAPLSQLRTQERLIETGTAIAASDVMALAGQIERALCEHGLEPICEPGTQVSYDPETMSPMSAQAALSQGAPVTIRFIGYRYAGAVVRKALVERGE